MFLPYKSHAARVETYVAVCALHRLIFITAVVVVVVVYLALICVNNSIPLLAWDRSAVQRGGRNEFVEIFATAPLDNSFYTVICAQSWVSDKFTHTTSMPVNTYKQPVLRHVMRGCGPQLDLCRSQSSSFITLHINMQSTPAKQ